MRKELVVEQAASQVSRQKSRTTRSFIISVVALKQSPFSEVRF